MWHGLTDLYPERLKALDTKKISAAFVDRLKGCGPAEHGYMQRLISKHDIFTLARYAKRWSEPVQAARISLEGETEDWDDE